MDKRLRLTLLSFLLMGLISVVILNAGATAKPTNAQAATPVLYAWGNNMWFELGSHILGESPVSSNTPIKVAITQNQTNITKVAAGQFFSLVMDKDGKLYAWGNNYFGALGIGNNRDTANTLTEVKSPAGVTGFTDFSTKKMHSLAMGNDGKLYAWGNNNYGQLGNGTTNDSNAPVPVSLPAGITAFTDFAVGELHSLALGNNGKLYAWGSNDYGQLGYNTTYNSLAPIEVESPTEVTAFIKIAAGNGYSLALGNNGKLYAWGRNDYGQLGNGTTNNSFVPVEVNLPAGITAFTKIAAGIDHNLALGNDGKLYAWGSNEHGQLGNNTTNNSVVPVPVSLPSGVTTFTKFEAGKGYTVAMGNDGKLYSWGWNPYGNLGNGSYEDSHIAVPVVLPASLAAFTDFAVGYYHSFAFGIPAAPPTTVTPTTTVTPPATVTPPTAKPAELLTKLRVSPDREFSISKSGELLTYTLNLKNIGPGRAGDVYVRFPIPAGLELGYPEFSNKSIWIEKIVTDADQPYIQIRYPAFDTKQETEVKLFFRAAPDAKPDTTILSRYSVFWSDQVRGANSRTSNGVRFVLTAKSDSTNLTGGEVQNLSADSSNLPSGGALAISGDFYLPNELVTFWYTDKNNQSTELAKIKADANGALTFTLKAGDLKGKAGESFVVVGYGNSSGVYGSVAIQVAATSAQSTSYTEK